MFRDIEIVGLEQYEIRRIKFYHIEKKRKKNRMEEESALSTTKRPMEMNEQRMR